MRTNLTLAAVLLIATPAAARPVLLAEATQSGSFWSNTPVGISVGFRSSAGYVEIGGGYLPSDIGLVNTMTPEQLVIAQAALTSQDGTIRMLVLATGGETSADRAIWNDFTTYAPKLGFALAGYTITGIEQRIDDVHYVVNCGALCYSTAFGTQTVKIFGEPPTQYPPLVGDYSRNGTVDAADYVVWRNLMSMPVGSRPDLPNAAQGPRPPQESDHFIWRFYFGESVPPLATAIPEPASWLLACLALCFLRKTKR
jgi:hypothetical protein